MFKFQRRNAQTAFLTQAPIVNVMGSNLVPSKYYYTRGHSVKSCKVSEFNSSLGYFNAIKSVFLNRWVANHFNARVIVAL